MPKNIILLILIFIISSCSAQENLKDFYYPFSNKTETKVYKYVDKNDSTKIEYWKVISIPETNELKTISYDSDFNIYNTFDEVITETGAELTAYSDFELNDNGDRKEIKAKVIDKDVYKWNGNNEYTYSVKYVNKYGRFDFKKKRAKSGLENITVNGKKYRAVKFRDDYLINAIDQNDEYGFYQNTFYAENIGMVKYERHIPNKVIELELVEILTEVKFKEIKASR
ncbi:hypothetical protein [Psychroserpens sp. Hel_I_66]|uniref:hypothetical protein n=1 Tax=Psychroserpens sp. Hel_I_66 TaxID=1250004 RepID=UPI0006488CA7|nr:hypothetical protein [Psychroserpens sp. Hel_I_66]